MRRKKLLAIVLLAVILSMAVLIAVNQLNSTSKSVGKYEQSIVRNADTVEKESALAAAENAKYTNIFKVQRLDGYGNSSDYLSQEKMKPSYIFANFIDSETIDYYSTRFGALKGNFLDIGFNYNASVYALDQINFAYVSPYLVRALASNGSILVESKGEVSYSGLYAYSNDSGFQEIHASDINFKFYNCYVVDMELTYYETYGNLDGFNSYVHQTIVVNESFKPLLICLQTSKALS